MGHEERKRGTVERLEEFEDVTDCCLPSVAKDVTDRCRALIKEFLIFKVSGFVLQILAPRNLNYCNNQS